MSLAAIAGCFAPRAVLIACAVAAVAPCAAQTFTPEPGITVVGELVDGAAVELVGARFGTKPGGEKALYVMLFEDGDTGVNAQLSRNGFSEHANYGAYQTETKPPHVQGGAWQYEYRGETSNAIQGPFILEGDRYYLYARVRTNWDGTDAFRAGGDVWNQKWWRHWAGDEGGTNNLIIGSYGQVRSASGNPRITAERTQRSNRGSFTGIPLAAFKNDWIVEQALVQQSGVGRDDGSVIWWGNSQVVRRTGVTNRNEAYPQPYRRFYWPQEQNRWAEPWFRHWVSAFYLDDSWARAVLELPNGEQQILPILKWSEASVTVLLRTGAAPGFAGGSIKVYDADNRLIPIGRFGAGPDADARSEPRARRR